MSKIFNIAIAIMAMVLPQRIYLICLTDFIELSPTVTDRLVDRV